MKQGIFLFAFLTGLFLCFSWMPFAVAWEGPQAIFLVADQVELADLGPEVMPTLHAWLSKGAAGIMNTNTAGGRTPTSSYVTIGAGKEANAGKEARLGFNKKEVYQGEEAGKLYLRYTGRESKEEEVLFLGAGAVQEQNQKTGASPGTLGTILRGAGLKTAVLGNVDLPEEPRRELVALVADQSGLVDYGEVSRATCKEDKEQFLSLKTDYEALFASFLSLKEKADFLAVELGDTSRLEDQAKLALPRVREEEKRFVLREIDAFLGQVLANVNLKETLVIFAVPTPSPKAAQAGNLLTPVFAWGQGITPGLLTSGTTQRPGLIANTDLAPTILSFFGLPVPPSMTGRPCRGVKGEEPYSTLLKLNKQIIFTHLLRPVAVKAYVIAQVIVILGVPVGIWLGLTRFLRYWHLPILALLLVPAAFLGAGLFPYSFSYISYVFLVFGLTLVFLVLALRCGSRWRLGSFIFVYLFTGGALLLDLFFGANLIKQSSLGYDPMSGARYYGLGNEYMGVLVGAALMGGASLLESFRPQKNLLSPLFFFFGLVLLVIAAPWWGTNFGGAVTAAVAFSYFFLQSRGIRVTPQVLCGLGGVLGLGLFLLFAGDLSREVEAQSHIGRTAFLVKEGSWGTLGEIIERKLTLSFKLIRYALWSRALLATLLGLAFFISRPEGIFKRLGERYPFLTLGFKSLFLASVAALIFNDSGIVAAATAAVYGTSLFLFLVLEEYTGTKV